MAPPESEAGLWGKRLNGKKRRSGAHSGAHQVSGGREVNSCDALQEEGKKRAPLLPCECHNVNTSAHGDVWHSHVGLGV